MRKFLLCIFYIVILLPAVMGCSRDKTDNDITSAPADYTTVAGTDEVTEKETDMATEEETDAATEEETDAATEEETDAATEKETDVATEAITDEITEAVPEPVTEPFVSTYSLLMAEPINPHKSGYEELDNLIDRLFAEILTEDMNKYTKVWTCYLYLVDNITYSRGMDAHTGEYSISDPAVTPVEILWATDLLNSGQGCCYNYSAAFTFIMRAIGYDAHLVTGNVPAYGGGMTPHCWMYVNLGGEKYSFDPDLDMNFFNRGENDTKDIWFGRKLSDLGYFYVGDKIHDI